MIETLRPDSDRDRLTRKFIESRRLVILSLNKACNLKCIYCRSDEGDWYDRLSQTAQSKYLAKANWAKLIELCRSNNVAEILLTGGEPSLYPFLPEFTKFLVDAETRFALHTHGLNQALYEIIELSKSFTFRPNFHVSLELFPELQNRLRRRELPLGFIDHAIASGHLVELKVIVHKGLVAMKERMKEQLAWWRERGVASIRFQPLMAMNEADSEYELDASCLELLELLRDVAISSGDFIRNTATHFDIVKSIVTGNRLHRERATTCRIDSKIIFITTDFQLLNCKSLWGKREDVNCDTHFDFVCAGYQS